MEIVKWLQRPHAYYDSNVISSFLVPGGSAAILVALILWQWSGLIAHPMALAILTACFAIPAVGFAMARRLDKKRGYVRIVTDGRGYVVFENSRVFVVLTVAEFREKRCPRGRGFTIEGFEGLIYWSTTHLGHRRLERMARD